MRGMTVHLGLAALLGAGLLTAPDAVFAQAAPKAPAKSVTFARDIAPIFQAKCQSCHEPGSIAPMSLVTFREARPWAKSIKARVETRQMPPWHIDRSVGVRDFKNDSSLTDVEIATITAWVDQGAPEGNPADFIAKPVTKGLYWQAERDGYGPPDLVITAPMQTMPAVNQDVWWRPLQEIPITEPRWVRMVEIRPANLQGRKILHHSIAYHVLSPDNVAAVNTGIAVGGRSASAAKDGCPASSRKAPSRLLPTGSATNSSSSALHNTTAPAMKKSPRK